VHRHYRTLRRVLQTAVEMGLAEAHSDRYRTLIYVAIDTGMRWSELVGLRRRSVDVARRTIRVVEQLVQLDDGSRVRRQPKTDSGTRTVTISGAVAAILADHLEHFVTPEPDALVFTNGAGQPLSHSSFQTHHFRKAQLAAGVS
jgi:integrase